MKRNSPGPSRHQQLHQKETVMNKQGSHSSRNDSNHCHRCATRKLTMEDSQSHYLAIIKSFESGCQKSLAGEITKNLSTSFLQRLKQIDNEANGNLYLRILTYQDWLVMLFRLNDSMVKNLKSLETDVAERMALLQRQVDEANNTSEYERLLQLQKRDIGILTKILRRAYLFDEWDFRGASFRTFSLSKIVGVELVSFSRTSSKRRRHSDEDSSTYSVDVVLDEPYHQEHDATNVKSPASSPYETEKSAVVAQNTVKEEQVPVTPEPSEEKPTFSGDRNQHKKSKSDPQPSKNKTKAVLEENMKPNLTEVIKMITDANPSPAEIKKVIEDPSNNQCRSTRSEPIITIMRANDKFKYILSRSVLFNPEKSDVDADETKEDVPVRQSETFTVHVTPDSANIETKLEPPEDSPSLNENQVTATQTDKNVINSLSYTIVPFQHEVVAADNLNALAAEVADKHDEVRSLTKKIIILEDEVQKSVKKIQLKDGAIKELRSELKSLDQERRESLRKLDSIRNELMLLPSFTEMEHLAYVETVDNAKNPDPDNVLLCNIHRSLYNLKKRFEDVRGDIYELRMENTELQARLDNENHLFKKANSCLNQIAEYFNSSFNEVVQFEQIYKSPDANNPFIDALENFKISSDRKHQQLTKAIESTEKKIAETEASLTAIEAEYARDRERNRQREEMDESRNVGGVCACCSSGQCSRIYESSKVVVVATRSSPESQQSNLELGSSKNSSGYVSMHYRDLFDDLANELESLKTGINNNQKEALESFSFQETYENNLKQLTEQNEGLEKALQDANKEKQALLGDLEDKNKVIMDTIRMVKKLLSDNRTENKQGLKELQKIVAETNSQVSPLAAKVIESPVEEKKTAGGEEDRPETKEFMVPTVGVGRHLLSLRNACSRVLCQKAFAEVVSKVDLMQKEIFNFHNFHYQIVTDMNKDFHRQYEKDRLRFENLSKEYDVLRRNTSVLQQINRDLNNKLSEASQKCSGVEKKYERLEKAYEVLRNNYEDLVSSNETLAKDFQNQSQRLNSCFKEVKKVEEKYVELEKNLAETSYEKKVLTSELTSLKANSDSLKNKLLVADNREKMLLNNIDILYQQIHDQQESLKKAEEKYKTLQEEFQKEVEKGKSNLDCLAGSNQLLIEENKKQAEYIAELTSLLDNYRLWKVGQITADEKNGEQIQKLQDSVRLLLEDRQNFQDIFFDLHRDFEIVHAELKRVRGEPTGYSDIAGAMTERQFLDRLNLIHKTLYRVLDEKEALQNEFNLVMNPIVFKDERPPSGADVDSASKAPSTSTSTSTSSSPKDAGSKSPKPNETPTVSHQM